MARKLLAILLLSIFLGLLFSSNSFADKNISISNFESQNVKICLNNQESSVELSIDEAEQIKNRFLEIEKNFIGAEKICKQLEILHEIGVLSSDFSLEFLHSIMEQLDTIRNQLFLLPRSHLILGGPMIVSHFTLGGRIRGILPRRTGYLLNFTHELEGLLNGSYFHQVIDFLPLYLGISFKPVFITAIDLNLRTIKSSKSIFFPFIELLIPCIGTSIAFYLKTNIPMKNPLFEYNIDVCLAGFLGGF